MSDRVNDLRRRQLAARLKAGQTDEMGFPKAPQGGSSTDSQAVSEFRPKAAAAFDGLVQGATFGLNDEYVGARDALFGGEGATFRERYATGRDAQRATNQASQENEPMAYGGGQVAGAMLPALAAAPLTSGSSVTGAAIRGGAIGAAEGGLHGLGNSNGVEPMREMGKGAAIGAGLGLAAPLAVGGAVGVARRLSDPTTGMIDAMLKRGNPNKANRAIAGAMQSSKKTPEQLAKEISQAGAAGQPEFRLMDALGTSGQRMTSGITRSGGDAGAEIAEYLASRQAGQGERVASFVDEGFGMEGNTAKAKIADLMSQRGKAADDAYGAARGNAAPVDVRGVVGVIDQRIGGMQGSNVAGDSIDGKLSKYRDRLAAKPAPNGEISRELSDFDRVLGVKQSIQDDIGAAVRAGRNNEARELGKLTKELDAALEQSSTPYRAANDGFREASGVIDAVDQGGAMSKPAVRADDAIGKFGTMSPDQQGAARVGYGDQLMAKIEANTSPTSNKAKMLQSPKRDAEAAAMTLNPEQYAGRLGRENTMWQTQNRALGGSMTADNMQDVAASSQAASGLGGAAKSALNFQFGDAVSKVGAALGPIAKGQSDATRQLIAKALMSSDPEKVLAPILKKQLSGDKKKRAIEALLRNSGREPSLQVYAP